MSKGNDLPLLLASLLVTAGLLGGGYWFLNRSNSNFLPSSSSGSPSSLESGTTGNSFAEVRNVPKGLFNYGGSTSWAPIRRDADPAIQVVWTDFKLRYTDPVQGKPGSKTGIQMLIENQLAFSQSSRAIKETEQQQAQAKNFRLKEIPVAIDGIAIAVHKSLDLPGLTVSQLADIYLGKVTNWNQVGGPDLEIVPFSRSLESGGTVEFFDENVLEKQPFAANVKIMPTTTEAIRALANQQGGIYYASAPEIVSQCSIKALPLGRKLNEWVSPYQNPPAPNAACDPQRNQLNMQAFQTGTYPITRRLFVIVKQNGQADEQAGEAYASLLLTNQGQELIAKAGFVRLR
jgi:phosphate transport system substrate-binding protein